MRHYICGLLLVFNLGLVSAQNPQKPNSVEIYRDLQALNVLGTVLYVAAHPDDEKHTTHILFF